MKYVVIDLEMNRIAKENQEECYPCGMEIIQIGAVVLDEKYQEIGCFKTLVKPEYNERIENYYSNLTKITTEMVENAPVFSTAMEMFLSWCLSLNDEIQIYQWSESDLDQVLKEIALKEFNIEDKYKDLLIEWQDFQKEYSETLNLDRAISLQAAIDYAGINMQGYLHDALHDARNTATLLSIVRIPEKREKMLGSVIDAFTPSSVGSTLGELFNFTNMTFIS